MCVVSEGRSLFAMTSPSVLSHYSCSFCSRGGWGGTQNQWEWVLSPWHSGHSSTIQTPTWKWPHYSRPHVAWYSNHGSRKWWSLCHISHRPPCVCSLTQLRGRRFRTDSGSRQQTKGVWLCCIQVSPSQQGRRTKWLPSRPTVCTSGVSEPLCDLNPWPASGTSASPGYELRYGGSVFEKNGKKDGAVLPHSVHGKPGEPFWLGDVVIAMHRGCRRSEIGHARQSAISRLIWHPIVLFSCVRSDKLDFYSTLFTILCVCTQIHSICMWITSITSLN